MITGIYKITNNINNKSYIGLSVDIENRIKTHFKKYKNINDKEYNKTLYRAMRKYGIENFSVEIIMECLKNELEKYEIYYIYYYNTYHDGYNETPGGDGVKNIQGEKHPNHKLTIEDVIDIRNRYNNHERCSEVYELYKDKIKRSGFNKVWKGETWKNIKMEVYTEENKKYHKHNTGNKGSKNGKAKISEEDVRYIREQKKNGKKCDDVYKEFKEKITLGSFKNIWYNCNWNEVII